MTRPAVPDQALIELLSAGRDIGRRFVVRRFAGPAAYAERMNPIRIAHVTDQHVGRVTPMRVQHRAIELVNAAKPDLVMLTGDFVCHGQGYLDALTEVLSGIEAPAFGVLGNHDHWSGGAAVKRALRDADVEVLGNAHTTIHVRHDPIVVLGLDDAYTGHADRSKALKGLPGHAPVVGLSHIAEEADGLWRGDVPLVLSGHTHAGQVTLAGLHELMVGRVVGHKYVHGLYGDREADAPKGSVYVGAGVGAAVVPLRMGKRARREVTIFELGVPLGSFDEDHPPQKPLPGRAPSERTRARRVASVVKKRARRIRKGRK